MNINHETSSEAVISVFSKTIEMFGLSALESRLFSYMFLKDEPMTLDEMSQALGKSKTAMSTSIRSLADWNLVSQVWRKGERKDLYVANTQLFNSLFYVYLQKWVNVASRQKEVLEQIKNEPDEKVAEYKLQFESKVGQIIEFHEDLEAAFRKLKQGME